MLGSAVTALGARAGAPSAATVPDARITVTGVRARRVHDVSFSVHRKEILGITGLPGNGYEDIPYLLTGAQPAAAGRIESSAGSVDLRRASVGACIRAGIVLVPERRDRDGLAFELNMRDNISLPALRRRGRPWFVARRWQYESAKAAVSQLDIRPRTPSILIKELSGGNQQKVLLAKWLGVGPRMLVLHEPTQAVDVGARQDILRALQDAAESGVAVVLVSSEPEDLAEVCDRILIHDSEAGLQPARSTNSELLIEQIYSETGSATLCRLRLPAHVDTARTPHRLRRRKPGGGTAGRHQRQPHPRSQLCRGQPYRRARRYLLVASVGGFDPTASATYLLPALAAVFLGTAIVQPRQFNPMGTFFGIYFLATGILGLQLLGYTGWVQDVFYGAGLVIAVTVATLVRQRTRTA